MTKRFARRTFTAAAFALTLSSASGGARAQDFEGARLLGFGGAQRALGAGNDALFVNPAGLAFSPSYEIEIGYADDFRESDRRIGLSIADGQAGPVAGAAGLTYGRFRPSLFASGPARLEGLRVDIAAAVVVTPGLALGASGRYVDYRFLAGDDEVEDAGTSGLGFDLGVQWQLADGLSLGATIQNVGDAPQPDLPRAWGAGVGYRSGSLTVEVDVDHAWNEREPIYTGTAGYVIADRFPVRAALSYLQGSEELALSLGAGFVYDRIGLDVAYRQVLDPRRRAEDADARLFVTSFRIRAF